jgi:hypothetical protein
MTGSGERRPQRLITVSPLGIERLIRRLGLQAHRAGPPMIIHGHAIFACWIEVNGSENACSRASESIGIHAAHQEVVKLLYMSCWSRWTSALSEADRSCATLLFRSGLHAARMARDIGLNLLPGRDAPLTDGIPYSSIRLTTGVCIFTRLRCA